ncbi:MAG: hypothetical protein HYU64_19640 [Armatimonadetes bacterium]|nr:hypothetical protein [Armatimonadota bacterium]
MARRLAQTEQRRETNIVASLSGIEEDLRKLSDLGIGKGPEILSFLSGFRTELDSFVEFSFYCASENLGILTRGEGPLFEKGLAELAGSFGLSKDTLSAFVSLTRYFPGVQTLFKVDFSGPSATELSVYYQYPLPIGQIVKVARQSGVTGFPLDSFRELARSLSRKTAFVGLEMTRDTGASLKVFLTLYQENGLRILQGDSPIPISPFVRSCLNQCPGGEGRKMYFALGFETGQEPGVAAGPPKVKIYLERVPLSLFFKGKAPLVKSLSRIFGTEEVKYVGFFPSLESPAVKLYYQKFYKASSNPGGQISLGLSETKWMRIS